ncbi:amino acid adenylation domain-containing protein [Desulfobacter vibrioformis]|uniref:non-ribosomal peptide synthetase n=1 Tax=Desulfobacter vibrioformis TaxID=34031 RepID=UPI000556441F|nr:amino acid adenylation domain-containing protein [Desulfobacter vibrioformis]
MLENKSMQAESITELITRLRSQGISLSKKDDTLRYKAPQGTLKDSDLQSLKLHKTDILEFLRAESEPVSVVPDPDSRFAPFSLTDVQVAYLLGRSDAFEYGGVACHIYLEINYRELAHKSVEAVWNQLIDRHDMLRATIHRDGQQQIMEKAPWLTVDYVDVSGFDEQNLADRLQEIREEMSHKVYDTETWPLFDIRLIKTPQQHVLHFSMEFLIADGASVRLLLSEFESLYFNKVPQLPDLQLTFRDYVITEKNIKNSPAYLKDKQYWLDRIDQLPPAPDLPLKNIKISEELIRFRRLLFKLEGQTWDNLKKQARKQGITPTALVMTAYAAVLERWSKNKFFSLNLTVLNRQALHEQVYDIVGDFTSVTILAVDFRDDKSFKEQARALNAQLFSDLDHRLFSGVEVLREITRRKGREAALMPIVLTSAIGLIDDRESHKLQGDINRHSITQTPQVFIDCQASDTNDGIQINWDVRKGVFPGQMVDDMFQAFETLIQSLINDHQIWESGATCPLPRHQLEERPQAENIKAPLSDKLLHYQITERMKHNGSAPAIIDNQGETTYEEMAKRASAIARELKRSGCKPQERVAIVMDKCAAQVSAVLGILFAEGVYVPIDISQPEIRRASIMEQANIRFVLTRSDLKLQWPEHIHAIEVDKLAPSDKTTLHATGDPDLPAYIIYTSGSTGAPKGVVISHRAVLNTIEDINKRFQVTENDKILGLAQLGFDLSIYDIFGLLSVGGVLVLPDSDRMTDPSHWAQLMADHGITLWNSVPALMQMLVSYLNSEKNCQLPNFRKALLSGDWIPINLPDQLRNRVPSVQIVSLGGATEASIWSIFHEYKGLKPEWKSIPYGRPLANQGVRVLDSGMRDCPVWVAGELYITGKGLALGYFGNQEFTDTSFFDHPKDGQRLYRTGDLGRYIPGGEIEFLGRKDNQVKIKGHRIELGEIEAALQKHPAVAVAGVVVDGCGDDRALLGVVETVQQKENVSVSELVNFIAQRLPAYMIPTHIQIADALPLTDNGKLDRKTLSTWRLKMIQERTAGGDRAQEMDELETQLSQLWISALGITNLGRSQNVYDLGADSLVIAHVASKVKELLNESPSFTADISFDNLIRHMLNYPTIEALAQVIRSHQSDKGAATRVVDKKSSEGPRSIGVFTNFGGGDTGPLRVIFHAGLGTLNSYMLLLDHLDRQQLGPVIGVSIKDTDKYCELDPGEAVEHIAEDYAQYLAETGHRQVQLIGHCLGGFTAIEVARRLLEKGIDVLDLALIDSLPVPVRVDDDWILEIIFVFALGISLQECGFGDLNPVDLKTAITTIINSNPEKIPQGSVFSIGGNPVLDRVRRMFQKLNTIELRQRFTAYGKAMQNVHGEDMPVEMLEGLYKAYNQAFKAAQFTPEPYMGDARFFLAEVTFGFLPSTHGAAIDFWRDIVLGDLKVTEITGDHNTSVEKEPHITDLSKLIAQPLI